MNKAYRRIEFVNDETRLNESNLNRIDMALDEIDDRVVRMDRTLSNQAESMKQAVEAATTAQEAKEIAEDAAAQAKIYMENAEAVVGVGIATKDKAGLVKADDILIDLDGTLRMITTTTDQTTMPNSYDGRLLVNEIGGVCEQESTTGSQLCKSVTKQSDTIYEAACFIDCDLQPSTTYTLSFKGVSGNTYYANESLFTENAWIYLSDDVCSVALTTKSELNASAYESGKGWIFLKNGKTQTTASKFEQVMLNLGTTALPYEPYTGGSPAPSPSFPMEIKKSVVTGIKTHGKNLLPYANNYKYSASGITVEAVGDGYSYKVYGTATGPIAIQIPMSINSKKVCIFSSNLADSDNSNIRLYYTENGSTTIKALAPTKTLDLSANEIKTLAFYIGSGATVNTVVKVQLEEGTVATEYEPYTESSITFSNPIDLCGIGDVQDVIIPKQINRRFTEVVFDGSDDELWQYESASKRMLTDLLRNSIKKPSYNNTTTNLLCSCFPNVTANHTYLGNMGISVQYDNGRVYLNLGNDMTLAEWKAYLQSNPMTVVYERATETTEELPIADQIALNSLATYDGITYVEFVSEIKPTFKGKYGTSEVGGYTLEGLLAGRNGELYGKRVEALEATVVNNI